MKHLNTRSFSAFIPIFAVMMLGWLPSTLLAQSGKSGASAHNDNFNAAVSLALKGNYTAAEAVLVTDNIQKRNSLAWALESATKYANLALALRANYDYRGALTVAKDANGLLSDGKLLAGASSNRKVETYVTIGLINERLLMDQGTAQAAYQLAAALNPQSTEANNGLTRTSGKGNGKTSIVGPKG